MWKGTVINMTRSGKSIIRKGLAGLLVVALAFSLITQAIAVGKTISASYLTLAPGSDQAQLNFSWHTTAAAKDNKPVVRIWKAGGEQKVFSGVGSTSTSGISKMYYNRVTVTGLEPDTVYTYQLGSGDGDWSREYTTKTGNASAFSFLVVGDPQIATDKNTAAWKATMTAAAARFPDAAFIMGTGDQVDSSSNRSQYEGFFSPEPLTSLPFASCLGNHEGSSNANMFYNPPNTQASPAADYWYSYGSVLFIVLNSNEPASQHEATLQKATEAHPDAKWRFLTFHVDVYGQGNAHALSDGKKYRDRIVEIIDKYGIDAVFNGHDHAYSRSYQMKWSGSADTSNSQGMQETGFDANGAAVDPAGTVYFTLNSATGSKYYGLASRQPYTAVMNQANQKNITVVDMTDNTFKCTTYQVSSTGDFTQVDTYAIVKTTGDAVTVPNNYHFDDVDETHYAWALEAVEALAGDGIVNGTAPRVYAPAANIKRGDFILMLVRAYDLKGDFDGNFSDVPPGSYYYNAIGTAKKLGIAQGTGGDRFLPDEPITRQDMMTLADRALHAIGQPLPKGSDADLSPFRDKEMVSGYAKDAVAALVRSGIVRGDGAGFINPLGNTTRAEMAVVLHRLLTHTNLSQNKGDYRAQFLRIVLRQPRLFYSFTSN